MPHLLSARDDAFPALMLRAEQVHHALQNHTFAPSPVFAGRTIALLFYEPSTRTRVAFESAAHHLGLHPITINAQSSSIVKGESIRDTVQTLCSEGISALVIRHPREGAPETAARYSTVPVLNAGDGSNEHPTQALTDRLTLQLAWGDLKGRKIAIVGDILHSRVARSNIWSLTQAGVEVWLCAPPTLLPPSFAGVKTTSCLSEALEGADAVMTLRMQNERMEGGLLPGLGAYARDYQINANNLRYANPDCLILHPGPINRGVEIDDETANSAQSLILKQVQHGLAARITALEFALNGV